MNRIDVTNNRTTHCVKNNVIIVKNREGLQGPPGRDGFTPYIDVDTGHWFINGEDQHVDATGDGKTPYVNDDGFWCLGDEVTPYKAQGQNGLTPSIDPVTFHWMIGEYDTEIVAKAEDGITPEIGENGNWWIGAVDTGVYARGLRPEDVPTLVYVNGLSDLPVVGTSKNLYILKDTNSIYYWDDDDSSYKSASTSSPFQNITVTDAENIANALNSINYADKIVEELNINGMYIICGSSDEIIY